MMAGCDGPTLGASGAPKVMMMPHNPELSRPPHSSLSSTFLLLPHTQALRLMRATVANATHYAEAEVAALAPSRDGLSWHSARLHHADIHVLPDGTWGGFVDGDRCVCDVTVCAPWFVCEYGWAVVGLRVCEPEPALMMRASRRWKGVSVG